jgi:hypothetical protein
MKQHTLKIVNSCLNTNIYSNLETSGGQRYNIYLNVVHFLTPVLIRHLWQLKTVVFLHWCLNTCCSIAQNYVDGCDVSDPWPFCTTLVPGSTLAGFFGHFHRRPTSREGRERPDDAPEHHEVHPALLRHHPQEDQLPGQEEVPYYGSRH